VPSLILDEDFGLSLYYDYLDNASSKFCYSPVHTQSSEFKSEKGSPEINLGLEFEQKLSSQSDSGTESEWSDTPNSSDSQNSIHIKSDSRSFIGHVLQALVQFFFLPAAQRGIEDNCPFEVLPNSEIIDTPVIPNESPLPSPTNRENEGKPIYLKVMETDLIGFQFEFDPGAYLQNMELVIE
jgi:hypothetical protein